MIVKKDIYRIHVYNNRIIVKKKNSYHFGKTIWLFFKTVNYFLKQ